MENLLFLGVPILKHMTVIFFFFLNGTQKGMFDHNKPTTGNVVIRTELDSVSLLVYIKTGFLLKKNVSESFLQCQSSSQFLS